MKKLIIGYYYKHITKHKSNYGEFHSSWKACGVGTVCTIIWFSSLVVFTMFKPTNFDKKLYDAEIAKFSQNEKIALRLFDSIKTSAPEKSIQYIDSFGVPIWEQNLLILKQIDTIQHLPFKNQDKNEVLRNYCNLRIESYKLIRQGLLEKTNKYDTLVKILDQKIEDEIFKMEE